MSWVGASQTEPVPRNVWSNPSPLVKVPMIPFVDFSTEKSIWPVRIEGEVSIDLQRFVFQLNSQNLVCGNWRFQYADSSSSDSCLEQPFQKGADETFFCIADPMPNRPRRNRTSLCRR